MTASTASASYANALGVFDSGVGGLSVLRAIREALPAEHLVYVADSGHAPYGDKSENYITARTLAIGRWLAAQGVKGITVACNTATVVAVQALRAQVQVPVVAIEPAIKPAVSLTRSGMVGVLATQQTVQSASVARLCAQHGGDTRILLQACPGWVEQVERAELDGPQTEALLQRDIAPLLAQGADTLVLGCTHYPFLREAIARIAGPEVTLIDPAQAVARELVRRLGPQVRAADGPAGQVHFLTTGDVAQVRPVIARLWAADANVQPLSPSSDMPAA
jgi:glutamate racemase